jgi:hypothetical protein
MIGEGRPRRIVIHVFHIAKEPGMRALTLSLVAVVSGLSLAAPASAQSCYDLWYERNEIFDRNGYCFSTDLGQETFDNSDCWTANPRLSRGEQRRVDQIKRQERRMGCRVNR